MTGKVKDAAGNATGQITPDYVPDGYTAANNPLDGGAYVSSIGRAAQLPPVAAEFVQSVFGEGGRVDLVMQYDGDGQYIGYDLVAFDQRGTQLRTISITGAASRFPPWELMTEPDAREVAQGKFKRATEMDAPPESGNFDGGFVASATQARRYADHKRFGDSP